MKIQEYNKDKARQLLDKWRSTKDLPVLSEEYITIRKDLIQHYKQITKEIDTKDRKEYITDVLFGLAIYDYFAKYAWFNLRIAANDDFWRYISVAVIPDIVADRWGVNNDIYFWKQSNRLWPKSIWWYIYLCWNENEEVTKNTLLSKNFNSDTIQGIVERTGKKGTFVEVYREIILQYSRLDYLVIAKFKKEMALGSDSLFRAIMKLNTAKCLVTDPCLCTNGVPGYVQSLFLDLTKNLSL